MWIVGFEFSLLGGVITPAFSYIPTLSSSIHLVETLCLALYFKSDSSQNCPGNSVGSTVAL